MCILILVNITTGEGIFSRFLGIPFFGVVFLIYDRGSFSKGCGEFFKILAEYTPLPCNDSDIPDSFDWLKDVN